MSETKKYSNSFMNDYPKLVLGIILLILIFLILCATELFLSYSKAQSISKVGKQRYIELGEAIPNANSSSSINQIQSADFILNSIFDTSNFKADENGFILPSYDHVNPDFSIVFLGDATTATLHLDGKDRFPYLVGQFLDNKTDYKINSYNAGYPGNDIVHSINRLMAVIVPLRPKIVVLMHSINDLMILNNHQSYWAIKGNSKIQEFSSKNKQHSVQDFFSLSELRESVFGSFCNKNSSNLSPTLILDTNRVYSDYRSALTTFVAICQDWRITPIILSQPHQALESFQTNPSIPFSNGDLISSIDRMNLISKEVAKQNNVKLIDLNLLLSNRTNYFSNFVNLNTKGSQKVAAVVSDSIAKWVNEPRLHH